VATSATGLEKSRSETGNSETGYSETTAPGHVSERQVASWQGCVRAQEKANGMLRRGELHAKLLTGAAKFVGESLGRWTKGGYTVEYRGVEAASTEISRSAKENSRIRTARLRKCSAKQRTKPGNLGRVGGWVVGTRQRGSRSCGCAEKSRSQTGCHLGDRWARYGTKTPSC